MSDALTYGPEAFALLQEQLAQTTKLAQSWQQKAEGLQHQIEQLLRRLYGPRSERLDPNQMFLDPILQAAQAEPVVEPVAEITVKATVRKKARPHGRAIIPEHLERVEVVHDLPEEQKVSGDGRALIKLRDEVSEKLAWKAGNWYVLRHVRPVYVHPERQSESAGVFTAPMPDSPIEKCKADPSVLAMVAIKKWADHLPLYRQREIFSREGIEVASSTLDAWAIDPILACKPLYDALKDDVLSQPILHTDDTPVPLQVVGRGKTQAARIWVYLAGVGPPHRFFDFTRDRCKERPAKILDRYAGYLQADAYSGYDSIFKARRTIIEVGCWAHARRKFDEAKSSAMSESLEMLSRIRRFYEIERRFREADPAARQRARESEAIPLLEAFFERCGELAPQTLPSSPLGKALTYALNQQKALLRYVTDGRLQIDNNLAENAIRPLALGRKNWLFAGSDKGGKACAIALSLIQSARALDLNPYEYLLDVYRRIMSHPVCRLHELLPAQWKASHTDA